MRGGAWLDEREAGSAIAVVGLPMLVTAGLLVAVDGSLRSLVVVLAVIPPTTLAVAGAGSAVSRWFVTPVPDSGNPFANRQAMKGAGVLTALGATVYLAGVAAVIAPLEWGLWWASDGRWGWFAVIAAAASGAAWPASGNTTRVTLRMWTPSAAPVARTSRASTVSCNPGMPTAGSPAVSAARCVTAPCVTAARSWSTRAWAR